MWLGLGSPDGVLSVDGGFQKQEVGGARGVRALREDLVLFYVSKNQIKNQADSRDNEIFKDRLMVYRGSCVE